MRRRRRKNDNCKEFINNEMTPETYKKKKKVVRVLYELRDLGFIIPRIDVRIGKSKHYNTLALARLNNNIMWISERAVEQTENKFYHTILHEIIHTIYGCEHDEKCHLMSTYQPKVVYSKNKLLTIFKNYYNKYNNITKQVA